jgi:hypothetical protein
MDETEWFLQDISPTPRRFKITIAPADWKPIMGCASLPKMNAPLLWIFRQRWLFNLLPRTIRAAIFHRIFLDPPTLEVD